MIHPGLLVSEWRWKWLTDNGVTREWKNRSRALGMAE
jgi:hypothetical protein